MDNLVDYFEEYRLSSSEKEKNKIELSFLRFIYENNGFKLKKNQDIIFGNLYEDEFEINHKQKSLFIKWCIHKMFLNYLFEDEYEEKSKERNQKRAFEIDYKYLWDTPDYDKKIEEYFSRTVYFEIKKHGWKFNRKDYFQCNECGGLFRRNMNAKNTRQKYCAKCKKIVSNRQKNEYKRRNFKTDKNIDN